MDEHLLQLFFRSTRHQPVQVEGQLHAVHASGHFTLVLEDGILTHGMLPESLSVEYLALFLGQHITIFGWGTVLPGGEILFVFAQGLLPQLKTPSKPRGLPGQFPKVRAEMANRLKQAIGAWPGDETEEQMDKALGELS
jgi:hypothetical protein